MKIEFLLVFVSLFLFGIFKRGLLKKIFFLVYINLFEEEDFFGWIIGIDFLLLILVFDVKFCCEDLFLVFDVVVDIEIYFLVFWF